MNASFDQRPSSPTAALSALGVSIWLDDLSRDRIISGGLQRLVDERNVVGITTNPTIFATAVAAGDAYSAQIRGLAAEGASAEEVVLELTTHDVASACDILRPVYDSTAGLDGRVSIEVGPNVAHDAAGTLAEALSLFAKVDRPNAYIKIPATVEGLEAITAATARGISVNITLIFGLDRYLAVIEAYLTGLETAFAAGIDLSTIHSVASFFVSRVDTEFDRRLDLVGSEAALGLKGQVGVANARLAYQIFEREFGSERARRLIANGANLQRPLWASTGIKNPAMADTTYVVELVAPHTVNTMPEKTLQATFDHGVIRGNTIDGTFESAQAVMDRVAELGISYDDVSATLEREGIEKFVESWRQLTLSVQSAIEGAR